VCVFKQNLNASVEEVESLLVSLILDNKIKGKVDQVQSHLKKNLKKVNKLLTDNGYTVIDRGDDQSCLQALRVWFEMKRQDTNIVVERIATTLCLKFVLFLKKYDLYFPFFFQLSTLNSLSLSLSLSTKTQEDCISSENCSQACPNE
jgi:hypothetical protein